MFPPTLCFRHVASYLPLSFSGPGYYSSLSLPTFVLARPLVVANVQSPFPLFLNISKQHRIEAIRSFVEQVPKNEIKWHSSLQPRPFPRHFSEEISSGDYEGVSEADKKRPSHLQLKDEEVADVTREYMDDVWNAVFSFMTDLREKEMSKKEWRVEWRKQYFY